MTPNVEQTWRYDLPDDWTPDGTWCVTIRIPSGVQYVSALQGALGLLTIEKSWARDDTRTGAKIVAHTWEAALYAQPMLVDEQECAIVTTPPPIPDEAAAADAAAALIITFFQGVVAMLNGCATTDPACSGCVDTLMSTFAPYGAGAGTRTMLNQFCHALNAMTPTERASLETDCPYVGFFGDLKANIAATPYDWLNNLSDWIFNWLNTTSGTLLSDLALVGAALGGNEIQAYVNANGGIPSGGGASFGGTCPWSHTIDLTATDGGFVAILCGAIWVSGEGWQNDGTGVNWQEANYIQLTVPAFDLTSLSFTWLCSAPYVSYQGANVNASLDSSYAFVDYDNALANIDATLLHTQDAHVNKIGCSINIFFDNPQPRNHITSCTVTGLGFNPFE